MFINIFYVLCLGTTLNVYVVYYENRLVSNVWVWFELGICQTNSYVVTPLYYVLFTMLLGYLKDLG